MLPYKTATNFTSKSDVGARLTKGKIIWNERDRKVEQWYNRLASGYENTTWAYRKTKFHQGLASVCCGLRFSILLPWLSSL